MGIWKEEWMDQNHTIDLGNLDEEVRTIGGKIAYVGTQLSKVEKTVFDLEKIEIPQWKAKWYNEHIDAEKNPSTGKAYSQGHWDHQRRLEPRDGELKQRLSDAKALYSILKARYDALNVQAKILESLSYRNWNPRNDITSTRGGV